MASWQWTTNFGTPATLANLVITQDDPALVATVDASADTYTEAYVWEARTLDGDWIEVERTADPELVYLLAAPNVLTTLRVRDWNGAADATGYSEPLEGEGTLDLPLWWMVDLGDGEEFTTELRWVEQGASVDKGLDQYVLEPLSGPDDEVAIPVVITGQRRAERVSFSVLVMQGDEHVARLLERASRQPSGSIALKSPAGHVFTVQLGPAAERVAEGYRTVDLSAIRVA